MTAIPGDPSTSETERPEPGPTNHERPLVNDPTAATGPATRIVGRRLSTAGARERHARPDHARQNTLPVATNVLLWWPGAWPRPLGLGLAAFIAAGIGEALLFQEASRPIAAALLVLAAILAALASGAPQLRRDATQSLGSATLLSVQRSLSPARLACTVGSCALAIASIVAYRANPGAVFGLQGVLWLSSIALLVVSCARWDRGSRTEADLGPAWSRSEAAVFTALIALSLFTHMAFLDEMPWRFHFDEGYAFTETMRYYRGPMIPLFTTTWHETSLPSLWFGFAAGWMYLLGPGLAGVRAGVAFIGALTVIPVYGISRLCWGRLAASLAGFAISVSAVYVHYSRVSITNVTTAFAWAVCFYFLLRGLRSHRPADFVWSGLAAGLSMYTYYGTRLLPILLVVFVAYMLIFHFAAFRRQASNFALLALGFLAGFGPLLGYFLDNPAMWPSRAMTVLNIPAAIPASWDSLLVDWNILSPLIGQNLLGFSVLPGRDTVYYAPFFLPAEAVLLVLGVGVLVKRWRQPAAFLLLLWGTSVVLLSTLVDSTTIPNFAHWAPAFPAFYLALVLPLSLLLGALLRQPKRAVRVAAFTSMLIILAWDLYANAHAYLVDYPPRVPPDHSLEALQGRYLASQGPDTRVFIVGPTWQPFNPEVAAMMAPETEAGNLLLSPDTQLPVAGDRKRNLAFLFYNDTFSLMPLVESYYPGGAWSDITTPDGTLVAHSYRVSAPLGP